MEIRRANLTIPPRRAALPEPPRALPAPPAPVTRYAPAPEPYDEEVVYRREVITFEYHAQLPSGERVPILPPGTQRLARGGRALPPPVYADTDMPRPRRQRERTRRWSRSRWGSVVLTAFCYALCVVLIMLLFVRPAKEAFPAAALATFVGMSYIANTIDGPAVEEPARDTQAVAATPVAPAPAAAAAGALAPVGTLQGAPSLTPAQIDEILASYDSPAQGSGQAWYDLGVEHSIDPAYAVAFFVHESSAGTDPIWAGWKDFNTKSNTHNVGNIICAGYATCYGRFRDYPDWKTGIADWYRLIDDEYIKGRGTLTVAQIIPIYAPSFENNVDVYVAAVNGLVKKWRAKYGQGDAAPAPASGPPLTIAITKVDAKGDTAVAIGGTITNTSGAPVTISFRDIGFRDDARKIYQTEGDGSRTLAPGEAVPFDLSVPVKLGTPLTFVVRVNGKTIETPVKL